MRLVLDTLRLANLIEQALSEARKKTRTNQLQLMVLLALGDTARPIGDGSIHMAATCHSLARELGVSRSAVGMQMGGLLKSGVVERVDLSQLADFTSIALDGRQPYYQLTSAGRKAYAMLQKQIRQIEQAAETSLTVKGAEAYGRTTRALCKLVAMGDVDEMRQSGERAKRDRRLRL